MTRYLLDTNIISHIVKPSPSASLLTWMAAQADDDLFISSVTVAEIRRGIVELPAGRRRQDLEAWFAGPSGPMSIFANRILPFNEGAALLWADFMAKGKLEGRPRSAFDMLIAATAIQSHCVIVTDNERDFAGFDVFNPVRS